MGLFQKLPDISSSDSPLGMRLLGEQETHCAISGCSVVSFLSYHGHKSVGFQSYSGAEERSIEIRQLKYHEAFHSNWNSTCFLNKSSSCTCMSLVDFENFLQCTHCFLEEQNFGGSYSTIQKCFFSQSSLEDWMKGFPIGFVISTSCHFQ